MHHAIRNLRHIATPLQQQAPTRSLPHISISPAPSAAACPCRPPVSGIIKSRGRASLTPSADIHLEEQRKRPEASRRVASASAWQGWLQATFEVMGAGVRSLPYGRTYHWDWNTRMGDILGAKDVECVRSLATGRGPLLT